MDNLNFTRADIIARIGYFRNKKNISAYSMGLELGHTKTYFYRIESGEIQLTMELFIKILKVLDVTPFEFFYPDPENYTEDLKNLELIKSLTAEELASVMTLLKLKR